MNLQDFLTAVATSATGGVIAIAAGYYLLKTTIQQNFTRHTKELKPDLLQPEHEKSNRKEMSAQLLPLRLQAHERLIVFIERINPANLFVRLHQQGIALADLQSILLNEIRAEYQHNVAQQLYVSSTTWNVVRGLKDDTLAMINHAAKALPPHAAGVELSRKVLQHMAENADNPYDLTLDLIKKDIHQLF